MRQLGGKRLKDFLRRDVRPPLDLVFVLQDLEDPVNVGAAFRIGDGVEVTELVLAGSTPCPPNETIHGVGRGTHRRVRWRHAESAQDAVLELRGLGYTCYALETTDASQAYHRVEYPEKVCLVVGNEHHGVTTRTLSACNGALYIPMYGRIHSLNAHVALAIVAYHCLHSRAGPAQT